MENLSITQASYINDYKIELTFNDGKIQVVDFGPFLKNSKHPEIKKYLELEKFKGFQIVDGDLDWDDFELTFPIWDLYTDNIFKNSKDRGLEAS